MGLCSPVGAPDPLPDGSNSNSLTLCLKFETVTITVLWLVTYFDTSRPTDVSNVVASSMLRTGYLFFYTEGENFLPFAFRLKFNTYLSFPSCVLSVTPFGLSYHRINVF